jgi:nucleoside 2-deoxyribosyltransferase
MTDYEVHAYLAGPDVFFPEAVEMGKRKKDYLERLGIIGHFPLDNEISKKESVHPQRDSRRIADANEKMMLDCCGDNKIGIILMNMSPFRGPSMDVGTAFEAGFMSALAKKSNVIIVGYTSDTRKFEERVITDIYGGPENITAQNGEIHGSDGIMIETFGGADNLMITAAIERSGGKIYQTFEDAAQLAITLAQEKITALSGMASPKKQDLQHGSCDQT